jgi:hypothetical protein
MAKNRRAGKGTYGDVRLPVAGVYVRTAARNRFLALGGVGLAVLAAIAAWSFLRRDAGLISNGPLASAHAALEADCAACHGGGFSGAADRACRACHERSAGAPLAALPATDPDAGRWAVADAGSETMPDGTPAASAGAGAVADASAPAVPAANPGATTAAGADPVAAPATAGDPGIYTLAAHWSVSPEDQRRTPLPAEVPCAACHLEHRGRRAEIARVTDARCRTCHEFKSFTTGHPEFDFAAGQLPDSDALTFPHSHHVNELMRRRSLTDVEPACLACHEPRPETVAGEGGFRPIDFDRHCSGCHLTAADRTPPLPVAAANGSAIGVETLEAVRRRGGPAARWTAELSTAEFLRFGDRVVKTPLRHEDPWVLHNLRLLRRRLYPDAGMADLLTASTGAPSGDAGALYAEAIATLERQAEGLRSRPERELQAELARIEALLAELRHRVESPGARLDDGGFRLAAAPGAAPDPAEAKAVAALAADLTEPCRRCHLVEDATIVRIEPDQRTLRRAEFDHRPHLLQRRCLDCHDAIPIADYLGKEEPAPKAVDHAAIQDLPRIATCRECHAPRRASESCVTCHVFHPHPGQRLARLLAAAGGAGGARNGDRRAAETTVKEPSNAD